MRRRVVVGAVVLALAGGWTPSSEAVEGYEPRVVVAVADTGVNPYHEIYYRPELTEHPCTWVAGYDDCSVPALDLSIGEYDTWEQAFEADREIWDSVERHRWYWIPRTNIIGAVCQAPSSGSTAGGLVEDDNCILDDNMHGTATTSSVLTEDPEALLLVHEGSSDAPDLETAPVVPDIQSHSWGYAVPLPVHAADPIIPGKPYDCDTPPFHPETLMFLAAGNNTPAPSLLDCARSQPDVQVVGGGFPGYWHSTSVTTYDFASWYCRPAASYRSISASIEQRLCGTSFSAPTAAGAASRALLEIRRREGFTGGSTAGMVSAHLTRDDFLDALRAAASYTPEAKFDEEPTASSLPLPPQAPWLFWGYGWLDSTVSDAIVACATGGVCPEPDPIGAGYLQARQDVRRTTTQDAVGDGQNDAGSGGDAPDRPVPLVRIERGEVYEAYVNGRSDTDDWYVMSVTAGEVVNARAAGPYGCLRIVTPDGAVLGSQCQALTGFVQTAETSAVAPADGDLFLNYYNFVPQNYRIGVEVDEPAPAFGPPVP